ncbi:MAG: helical backbone metal receptor [Endomicrobia bacterium]|nr:helical backbone metal receptor [Endomicrobiia bacterium]MCL2800027.1 helical backbone metal receptor [Endomicrobiia bacterium]
MKKIYTALLFLFFINGIVFGAEYKRIVSLAPSVTASLYELGVESNIAAITVYCPEGSTKKEIIGTLIEPDLEKIISLKPDLIIASKEGNSRHAVEKLIELGLNIYVMETAQSFNDICANYLDLAEAIGAANTASANIESAKNKINDISNSIHGDNIQSVFWEVGAKPLYTAGGQSFVNDYNFWTKTVNLFGDLSGRYPQADVEVVVSRNPDIIILVNMGDITDYEVNRWKKYKTLKAARNNKIFMIDVNSIFTPTPGTFADGVKILAEKIYGKQ